MSGKTSLISSFTYGEFPSIPYATTHHTKTYRPAVQTFKHTMYMLELIDTPPLENYYKSVPKQVGKVDAVVFTFDASNKGSFLRMAEFVNTISLYEKQKVGVLATKKDLCPEFAKYKYYQLENYCKEYGMDCAFVSAKDEKDPTLKLFFANFIDDLIPIHVAILKVFHIKLPVFNVVKKRKEKEDTSSRRRGRKKHKKKTLGGEDIADISYSSISSDSSISFSLDEKAIQDTKSEMNLEEVRKKYLPSDYEEK